ncbi:DUF619-domain-containing protein [Peniophora sp. CONT]|nr:DUF619-domain-containing protein [Peniophora sp. CONT]
MLSVCGSRSLAKTRSAQSSFKAFYATVRGLRSAPEPEDHEGLPENDFILSILRANPSARDAKGYLTHFGIHPKPAAQPTARTPEPVTSASLPDAERAQALAAEAATRAPVLESILHPVYRRTALVKIQGPFTDRQLDSIARGMVYLDKAGLTSVIVVEHDDLPKGEENEREVILHETLRVVKALEAQGARARPFLGPVVRLGPKPEDAVSQSQTQTQARPGSFIEPEAHTLPYDLSPIRSALRAQETPVLAPFALDSFLRSCRVDANDVLGALARGMVEVADSDRVSRGTDDSPYEDVDLTPLRLMIINREGGVPSYARAGLPHLLVNLESEYEFIRDTFLPQWKGTHRSALSNLALARTCLAYMPPTSSAIMVNHRAPSSLIGNLVTNKPVVSSSLPHALLQGNRSLTPTTPTLLRLGSSIEVINDFHDIDRDKMTHLLEQSFKRTLDADSFYARLERSLDFVIVAGDYAGAAIVTREGEDQSISYLDKFAVLPTHQGDGTVDFLWVALHDETYGLGAPHSANPNGGKQGVGEGPDLVWRSRANNPVNKWYFERSSGHVRMGDWVLFWCDGEKKLHLERGRRASAGLSYVEDWERGRLSVWQDAIPKIASCWSK